MSKKVWTMEEYDKATLDSYHDGFREGMLIAHGVASATVQSLITSIDDVVNLYENKYDVDIHLPMVKQALIKVMGEMDKNYLDACRDAEDEHSYINDWVSEDADEDDDQVPSL